jgi:hypothetical protein
MRARLLRSRQGLGHAWLHLDLLGYHITISRWGIACVRGSAHPADASVYLMVAICAAIAIGALIA